MLDAGHKTGTGMAARCPSRFGLLWGTPSFHRPRAPLVLLLAGWIDGCVVAPVSDLGPNGSPRDAANASPAPAKEQAFQERFSKTGITLRLGVLDTKGQPLSGVLVELRSSDQATTLAHAQSDALGRVELREVARRNAFVLVRAPGYYDEWIPARLHRPLDQTEVNLGPVQLVERAPNRMRLTFSGDVMFGRRYFDRDEDGILGEDNDLLFLGSVEQDTLRLFRYMRGYLASDDHTSINLETTLLTSELEGHPKNRYVFHSDAQSARALRPAGVDSVSLGNNHLFDYLEPGVQETIGALDGAGVPWFGAGMDLSRARASWLRLEKGELGVAIQGFSDITGLGYEEPNLRFLATAEPKKAGILPAFPSELRKFVQAPELANDVVIPVLHGGAEFVWLPTQRVQADLEELVGAGADLVIAHHPHVPSGIWRYDKNEHSALVVGSLGNFVFDQLKFESFFSYLVVVDVFRDAEMTVVERMSLIPIAIQDFVPRPMMSYAAQSLGRKIAHLSSQENLPAGPGWQPTKLSFRQGRFWVQASTGAPEALASTQTSSHQLSPGLGMPIDLRGSEGEGLSYLSHLSSDVAVSCQLGKDLLVGLGRFEDTDVDAQQLEGDNWSWSEYRFMQGHATKLGSGAAALIRHRGQESRVRFPFRSTVPIQGALSLTLHGWQREEQSGKLSAKVRWRRANGSGVHEQEHEIAPALAHDWSPFAVELFPPAESAGIRLEFFLAPHPELEPSTRYLDEVSLIEWSSETLPVGPQGLTLDPAAGWEFVRCHAPVGGAVLELNFRG